MPDMEHYLRLRCQQDAGVCSIELGTVREYYVNMSDEEFRNWIVCDNIMSANEEVDLQTEYLNTTRPDSRADYLSSLINVYQWRWAVNQVRLLLGV